MGQRVIVGLDTSNYTTSCAICNMDGEIIENYKELLPVKEGENGLRQSDAVFAHVKNFQIISAKIREKHADYEIVAFGYSAYPRDVMGSYMPCFLVGQAIAQMASSLYNVPVFAFSHQAGHIKAASYSSGYEEKEPFIAFHVSGGTTEILHVTPIDTGYKINLLGGSSDLHAGQAIDRIGVKMGLRFPCGKELEKLALQNESKIPSFKTSINGYSCNLSGLENLSLNLFKKTENKTLVAAFVLKFIEKTIAKLTENLRGEYYDIPIVYAGGVMSNSIIKEGLLNSFSNIYFAEPQYSTDNAAGIALLTRKEFLK